MAFDILREWQRVEAMLPFLASVADIVEVQASKPRWALAIGEVVLSSSAATKSEARAEFKKHLGPIPPGTVIKKEPPQCVISPS